MAPPRTVKTSKGGIRLRTGPPVSQKQVRFAAKAAIVRAGQLIQILARRTTPVATAARRPSARLTAVKSRPMGIRERSGPGTRNVP